MRSQLENRLAEAERIKEESVSELEALRKQLDEERSARGAAESQVKELTSDVAAAKASADDATAQLEEERSQRAAAESKVEALASEVAAATAGAGDAAAALEARLRAETAAAEEKAARLATENTLLEKKLQAAQEQVAALENDRTIAEKNHTEQLQYGAMPCLPLDRHALFYATNRVVDVFASLQGGHCESSSSS